MWATPYVFREKGHPAIRRCVVGGAPLQLKKRYDPDQGWLSFMVGAVFDHRDTGERTPGQLKADKATLEKKTADMWLRHARPFMVIPDAARYMHAFEIPDQYPLPFEGHWRIRHKDFALLQQQRLPGFERTQTGKVCTVHFASEDRAAVIAWCEANTTGYYNVSKNFATFSKITDAAGVKMIYGGPQRKTPK